LAEAVRRAGAGSACTFGVGELPAGAAVLVRFAVTVDDPVPAGVEVLRNTAVVRDGDGGGDSGEEETPVAAAVDLELGKTDGGVSVRAGDELVYTLTVANRGDQDASGVVVEEWLPEFSRFVAGASGAGWSCGEAGAGEPAGLAAGLKADRVQSPLKADRVQSPLKADRVRAGDLRAAGGTVCRWQVGGLPVGAVREIRFGVVVDGTLPEEIDRLVNRAVVFDDGAGGPDADPSDDEVRVETPVEPEEPGEPGDPGDPDEPGEPDGPGGPDGPEPPDAPLLDLFLDDRLAEDRDGSGGVSAGDVLSYAVRVENLGAAVAESVVFEVAALEHLGPVAGSVRGEGAEALAAGESGGPVLRVVLGDLAAGERFGFAWDAVLDGELPEELRRVVARGTVVAEGLAEHPSDDPQTVVADDPTVTPLGGAGGPGEPVEIPTLSEWGLILLTLLLALVGWRALR
jgi:uncharacterized repeat protein (TIGR01451 family)